MRRNYISPEFVKSRVNGTLNMIEESSFFGAKMLEIEDSILVSTENIIWFENAIGEQIDLESEDALPPNTFSSAGQKLVNHTLVIDDSQSQYTRDNATKWILDVDINSILTEYIFAELKSNRTFEGIRTQMTAFNDIDLAIKSYIASNVIDRYKMSRFDLYIKYVDLKQQNVLRLKNKWNSEIVSPDYLLKRFETVSDFEGKNIRVLFGQEKPSTLFNFEYFFNILYEKV